MLRKCRKCGNEYPLNKKNFGHMPNGGFRYTCRSCVRANVRDHYYRDRDYHIDHKTPIANGGEHTLANYALACLQCNQENHNKDLDEYRAWLRKNGEPVRF